MACGALTAPVAGFCATGCVLPPAFCASTRSFVSLSHRRRTGLSAVVATVPLAARSDVLRTRRRRRPELRLGLTRLSGDAGHKVLPSLATSDQWAHYWGGSETERVGKFFEVSAVAFLGLWGCYFTSFFLGVGTTSVLGASFLFYWLLAPNVTAFRRNRALRGRIAPFPGGEGNSMAIFSARVASATEEYHPVTGQPVFLRMVIEDEDGRALKFRTRTRAEYARIRRGMLAEAVLVSPDGGFDEILGVSDTFIPAANVWVGEYPYLDKVVMRRLLASRDSKQRQLGADGNRDDDQEEEELDAMTFRDAWTQTRPLDDDDDSGEEEMLPPAPVLESSSGSTSDYYYADSDDEPQFEGWGSLGFSSASSDEGLDGTGGRRKQWERVSGSPRPRRRPAARTLEDEGSYYSGRPVRDARSGGSKLGRSERRGGSEDARDYRSSTVAGQGGEGGSRYRSR